MKISLDIVKKLRVLKILRFYRYYEILGVDE